MRSVLKLMLISYHGDHVLAEHPEVAPLLRSGWTMRSAAPRVAAGQQPMQLVVLERVAGQPVEPPHVRRRRAGAVAPPAASERRGALLEDRLEGSRTEERQHRAASNRVDDRPQIAGE